MKAGKKKLVFLAAAVLVCLAMAGSAFAASSVIRMLEARYVGVKLVVNGVLVNPKDVEGNVVEPFINEGTTYLPVRALAEALSQDVHWDDETKTVYIGTVPGQETSWMKMLPPYAVTGTGSRVLNGDDHEDYITVAGVRLPEGVVFQHAPGEGGATALWNTDHKYRSIVFTVGHEDTTTTGSAVLEIYRGGELVGSREIKWTDPPTKYAIPLLYSGNCQITLKIEQRDTAYCVYDISFTE